MTQLDNYTSYDDDSHGDDIFGDLTYEEEPPNDLIVTIDGKDNSVEDILIKGSNLNILINKHLFSTQNFQSSIILTSIRLRRVKS